MPPASRLASFDTAQRGGGLPLPLPRPLPEADAGALAEPIGAAGSAVPGATVSGAVDYVPNSTDATTRSLVARRVR